MADKESALKALAWFDDTVYADRIAEVKRYYDELCSMNTVKTPDELFNYYMNYWVPVQMSWVASLDRGWPSGMRGTRDSANDYTALVYTDLNNAES